MTIAQQVLNFTGGTIRWIFGSIWRTIFKKPKFSFEEYIYGPKDPNYYDKTGHSFNNVLIGTLGLIFIIVPIIQLIFS